MTNYFSFSLNAKANQRLTFGQLNGSSLSLAIAELVKTQEHPVVLVVHDTPTALYLEQEISFLLAESAIPVRLFPDWETLPYDGFSPHHDLVSERLATL